MRNRENQVVDSRSSESFLDLYAEGQRYFMGNGTLNKALAELAAQLKKHDIDYAVIGAVALVAARLSDALPKTSI